MMKKKRRLMVLSACLPTVLASRLRPEPLPIPAHCMWVERVGEDDGKFRQWRYTLRVFGLGLRVRALLSVQRLRLEHLPTLAVERSGLGV